MTAPSWIEAAVREFGSGAGLENFSLNERGVAAVRFENGITLRFEYALGELVVVMTVPVNSSTESVKRILSYSHPDARCGAKVRSGYLAKKGCALLAVRLASGDVTLPVINTTFGVLWRIATELGGVA